MWKQDKSSITYFELEVVVDRVHYKSPDTEIRGALPTTTFAILTSFLSTNFRLSSPSHRLEILEK